MKIKLSSNISEDVTNDLIISTWQNQQSAKKIAEVLFGLTVKEIKALHEQIEEDIEFILRNKIDKPIKGEITKSKLRWRGIKNIAYGDNFQFLGIMQREKLITKE
ncbi:MAG: hypothetical protein QM660_11030 [Dysgonomonas sp.]